MLNVDKDMLDYGGYVANPAAQFVRLDQGNWHQRGAPERRRFMVVGTVRTAVTPTIEVSDSERLAVTAEERAKGAAKPRLGHGPWG